MSFKHWLTYMSGGNRRSAIRRSGAGFAAGYWSGADLKREWIRDISATGMYLLTQEKWAPGTHISLSIHRANLLPTRHDRQVVMGARAVRNGEDGVGLAFEIPAGIDTEQWVGAVEHATRALDPDDLVGPFKMAKAMAFLGRACPSGARILRQQIRAMVTPNRVWNAVEISLMAEEIIGPFEAGEDLHGDAHNIQRIVQDGSWADDGAIQSCWAGLLAADCAGRADAHTSRTLINAFAQLTLPHIRILHAACEKAERQRTEREDNRPLRLTATTEEIMRFAGLRDLLRMGRSLEHLSEVGLLRERFKPSMFVPVEQFDITPTELGLELYSRCRGHRQKPAPSYASAAEGKPQMAQI